MIPDENLQLRRGAELAGLGTWRWDLATAEVRLSRVTSEIFGVEADRPIGPDAFFAAVYADDRERVRGEVAASVTTANQVAYTCRIVRTDGDVRQLQAWCEPEFADDGSRAAICGTIQDVTSLRHDERQRTEQRIELEARSRREFIAHELRTPLTSIIGYLEILSEENTAEDQREFLGIVDRNARRLLPLVDELLGVSQQPGASRGEPETARPRELAAQ